MLTRTAARAIISRFSPDLRNPKGPASNVGRGEQGKAREKTKLIVASSPMTGVRKRMPGKAFPRADERGACRYSTSKRT